MIFSAAFKPWGRSWKGEGCVHIPARDANHIARVIKSDARPAQLKERLGTIIFSGKLGRRLSILV